MKRERERVQNPGGKKNEEIIDQATSREVYYIDTSACLGALSAIASHGGSCDPQGRNIVVFALMEESK